MAAHGSTGVFQLPRGARQLRRFEVLPTRGRKAVVACPTPTQSKESHRLDTLRSNRRSASAESAYSASTPLGSLGRHLLKVGAVCAKVRPYGSVRGAWRNPRSYRDSILLKEAAISSAIA